MDYSEFEVLLKQAGLSKTKFAEINGLHKNSVSNWKQKEVPGWAKPWLENYIEAQAFQKVKDAVNDTQAGNKA